MAYIPERDFLWRPDTSSLISFAGLAVVREEDRDALHAFLDRHSYERVSIDCSGGGQSFRRALDPIIGFEEDIGYPLAGQTNLDALADGWNLLPTSPRRLVLELVNAQDLWAEDEQWMRGFLAIASEASRRHLVGGSLLFTVLIVPEGSPMIGADIYTVSLPWPLDRRQLEHVSERE